jgi:hypothetical protein
MKQRIFITVIPGAPGEHLLDCAQEMLAEGSVVDYIQSLIDSDSVLFYSDHLDLWSMGDSFDRFLRPKSRLRYFVAGSSELYAIRRDILQLRAAPRDDEERMLRALLYSAKSIYKSATLDTLMFVLRQVFKASGDTSLDSQPRPMRCREPVRL